MNGEMIIGLLIVAIEVEIVGLSGSSERLVMHVWLSAFVVVMLLILLLLVMLLMLHVILCLLVLVVCARLVIK